MARQPSKKEAGKVVVMPPDRREIATVYNDVTAPLNGYVMQPRDDVLASRGRGRGLAIYRDLMRDAHVKAVMRKRILAVIAREWTVEPASDRPEDEAAAELVRAALLRFPFDKSCKGLLQAIRDGYAVAEVIWAPVTIEGRTWVLPQAVKPKNPSRFVFGPSGDLRLLTWSNMLQGEELPARKFVVTRDGEEETEDPYGLGLGNALFWPVFFKRKGVAFWLTFADKFGAPTSVGTYPAGATPEEQQKLLEALRALAQDTGVVIPEGMEIKFLEAQRYGTVNTYEQLARWCDEQISEAVLGETLSTNIGDTGSRAASETHNEVREELTDADADLLCGALNDQLIRWIVEINLPGATPPSVWRHSADDEDLSLRATRDKTICEMGFEPSLDYIHETYGGEWQKKAAPAMPQLGAPPPGTVPPPRAPGAAADPAAFPPTAFAEEERDAADELADQLDDASAAMQTRQVDIIRAALDESASLAEFSEKLLALYPALPSAEFARLMGEALTAAELSGRADILDGN